MSGYRNLAPSLERARNSSSSSQSKGAPGSSIESSTRTTSREAIGLNESGGAAEDGDKEGAGGAEEPMRKRRAPGTVSGRACNECRQARQKVSDVVAILLHLLPLPG